MVSAHGRNITADENNGASTAHTLFGDAQSLLHTLTQVAGGLGKHLTRWGKFTAAATAKSPEGFPPRIAANPTAQGIQALALKAIGGGFPHGARKAALSLGKMRPATKEDQSPLRGAAKGVRWSECHDFCGISPVIPYVRLYVLVRMPYRRYQRAIFSIGKPNQ
jgi:hypothetical protein